MADKKLTESKEWKLKDLKQGKVFKFLPHFKVKEDTDTIECEQVSVRIDDEKYEFNFLDLYMFIYFIANEELRRGLALKYQRQVNYIPYDVTFKLSDEEIQKKTAQRRIQLPVDELTMAIARNESWKLHLKDKGTGLFKKPWEIKKGR